VKYLDCKKENQIQTHIRLIVRKLIHPQAKDYYDEDMENRIITETVKILKTKNNSNLHQDMVKNYVLKMKIRNKIGLKLSRWVDYTELPKDLIAKDEKHVPNKVKHSSNCELNENKNSQSPQKKAKSQQYIDYMKICLERIKKRKQNLKDTLELTNDMHSNSKTNTVFGFSNENWQNTLAQSRMAEEIDIKTDLIGAMSEQSQKYKRKCDALRLLKSYLNQ